MEKLSPHDWSLQMEVVDDIARFLSSLNVLDVKLGSSELEVFVAMTADQRYRGLAGLSEDHLDEVDGMLFYFPQPSYLPMTVQDMEFDLVVRWFDDKGRLIKSSIALAGDQSPLLCPEPFSYVLEVPLSHPQADSDLKVSNGPRF